MQAQAGDNLKCGHRHFDGKEFYSYYYLDSLAPPKAPCATPTQYQYPQLVLVPRVSRP